jgi:hypothetical protein
MTRLAPTLLLLPLAALGAFAGDRPQDQTSVLETPALRVEINRQTGTFSVLDKASGYLWHAPEGGPVKTAELAVPKGQGVTVDGDLSEWQDRGVAVSLTPDMVTEGKKAGRPEDLSAQARLLWAPEGLFLSARVTDDKLVFPAAQEPEWWQEDCAEFWINGTQYAVRGGPWGSNLLASSGNAAGAQTAYRALGDGYAVEVFMPAPLLGDAMKRGLGGQLRFALGVNDCDGEGGRKGQLYYPRTWQHSSPSTFALVTLVAEDGKPIAAAPQTRNALTPVEPQPAGAAAFTTTVQSGAR